MKILTMNCIFGLSLVLSACGPQATPSTNPGGNTPALAFCPANDLQNLVGRQASEVGAAIADLPAEARASSYFVGESQKLPTEVERGATLVVLNTPIVGQNPDLSAYSVVAVKCFTGSE